MTIDQPLIAGIKAAFGEKSYHIDGKLDNKHIAQIVFNDQLALNKLNALVHPAVFRAFDEWEKTVSQNVPYTLKEAALLFESGSYEMCDVNILVTAPLKVKIERVMARDNVTEAQIMARIEKQFSDKQKLKLADFFIKCGGSIDYFTGFSATSRIFKVEEIMHVEIIADFIVLDKIGLFCKYGNFYLDPKEGVATAVISHAHGDHAVSGNQNVYCTKPTQAFMQHRYKKFAAIDFHIKDYKETFNVNGIDITFYSAGHMLGSALINMHYKGVNYLYTGDYKLEDDDTCEPIHLVQADVLITESTFADEATAHPLAIDEIKKLNAVAPNIMLGAYALGKSQRLIAMINKYCNGKTILVHHSVMPFVKIYQDFGIKMGPFQAYDRKLMKNSSRGMVIWYRQWFTIVTSEL